MSIGWLNRKFFTTKDTRYTKKNLCIKAFVIRCGPSWFMT
jgi:hypothetical protein